MADSDRGHRTVPHTGDLRVGAWAPRLFSEATSPCSI